MAEQRLPIVDGDDGQWGDILNQYISKEHYDTGVNNTENGGHMNITIRPGEIYAGMAPIKFTSGPLMTVPEAGAVEFLTDKLYLTQTTSTIRKVLAAYDDSSGATGDIYYRDSGSNFVRLPIGGASTVLGVNSGIPAWTDISSTYQVSSAKNQASGYAGLDTNSHITPSQIKDWTYVRQSEIDRQCSGLGGDTKESNLISINPSMATIDVGSGFGYLNDHTGNEDSFKRVDFAGGSNISPTGNGTSYVSINSIGNVVLSATKPTLGNNIYLGHIYVSGGYIAEVFNVPEWAGHFPGRVNEFMADGMKTIVAQGLEVSEQVTPLKISVSTGEMYARLSAIYVNSQITSFTKMYNNSGTWMMDSNNIDYINTTQWNDTSSGLVTMTDGYWKKDLIIMTPSKKVYYMFGQQEYADEDSARIGIIPVIPDEIKLDSAYLALLVCQKGDSSIANRLVNVTPNFSRIFGYGTSGGGAVVEHHALTGLNHDDHPIYALLSGRNGGQTITGGTEPGAVISLRGTSGVGTLSSPAIQTLVGNAGATIATTTLNSGKFGIGLTAPTSTLNIKAGSTAAETAPIKLTSGPLMTTPEVGSVEFLTDRLYFTQTTGTTRKTVAAYNDTSGATGDIYYRDSGGNFVRLAVGATTGQLLTVDGGLPSWSDLKDSYRQPRVTSIASSTAPTPNSDTTDTYIITALAATATFGAPTGTPVEGRKLIMRIKDNGTARTLNWNAAYRAGADLGLPAATVISMTTYLGFIYNSTDSRWDLVARVGGI